MLIDDFKWLTLFSSKQLKYASLISILVFVILGCLSSNQKLKKRHEANLILNQKKIEEFIQNKRLDSIFDLALEMNLIGRILNDTNVIVRSYYELGRNSFFLDKFNLAELILNDGYPIISSSSDSLLLISYLRCFGNVKSELGKYEEAKKLYLESLALMGNFESYRLEPILLMDLAYIESKISFDFQRVNYLFDQSLTKVLKSNSLRDTIFLYANYGAIIKNIDPGLALTLVNKAIRGQNAIGEFALQTHILKAEILLQLNQIKESTIILNDLKEKAADKGNPNWSFYIGFLEAKINFQKFQCKRGYEILESVIDLVPNDREFDEVITLLKNIKDCEEFKGKNQQILIKALNFSKIQSKELIQNEYTIAKELIDKKLKESNLLLAEEKAAIINQKFHFLSIILFLICVGIISSFIGYSKYKKEVVQKLNAYEKLMETINENEKFTLSDKIKRIQSSDLKIVDAYFKQNQSYLNPQFSKDEFLKSVPIDYEEILNLLREFKIANNFSDLVNIYRVDSAIQLMRDPFYSHFSIEGYAKKVGFGSRQSFYNAFEKHMGMSPTFFKENVKVS